MRLVRSVVGVRLPSVPGPADVLSAMGGVRDGISEALALVPRVGAAVGRMEELLSRVDGLLTRVESVVDRADEAIAAVADTRAKADDAIAGVADTRAKADDAIAGVAQTRAKADDAIAGVADTRAKADDAIAGVAQTRAKADEAIAAVARTRVAADEAIAAVGLTTSTADTLLARGDALIGRVEPLVGGYVQPLTDLTPSVRRLAETLEPHEVEALVRLIDQLPQLVTHLDEDILPILETLGSVGTDVHDLVDTVQDLRQVVKGFPGSRLFRRRGAEEIAQEEADEAAQDGARSPSA
jgi:ABC-type transporter Mla subunit MlaD